MHVDPNSPHAQLTKRQQEVLDRLEQGMGAKQIATDIGVSRNAVYHHIERLRRQGAARPVLHAERPAAAADRRRGLRFRLPLRRSRRARARWRGCASWPGRRRPPTTPSTRRRSRRRSRRGDAVALAYELGRLDAAGEPGLPVDLVESALRRLGALPDVDADPK